MQLALDALDRLVETLEETGPLSTVEAARSLFATSSISEGLAASLLVDVTAGDSRVVCSGASVSLTGETRDPLLDEAAFVVFDLETTGLSAQRDRICEIGAVRVQGLELVDSFQSLVNPGVALPGPVERLTGLAEEVTARRAEERLGERVEVLLETIDGRLPFGLYSGPGVNERTTPVKALSNSSVVTLVGPAAGSFR